MQASSASMDCGFVQNVLPDNSLVTIFELEKAFYESFYP
jgi:hypothetical protein